MGVSCSGCNSGCACDRHSRHEISREAQPLREETKHHQSEASTSASSKQKHRKDDDDMQECYFDLDDVVPNKVQSRPETVTTAAPDACPQADTEPTSVESERRQKTVPPKLDLSSLSDNLQDRGDTTPQSVAPQSNGEVIGERTPSKEAYSITADTTKDSVDIKRENSKDSHQKYGTSAGTSSPTATESPEKIGRQAKKRSSWRQSLSRSFTGNTNESKLKKGMRAASRRLSSRRQETPVSPDGRLRIKTNNANVPSDYRWLEATLESLANNQAHAVGATDAQTGKAFTPLFFVVGGCPNMLCGMQAIAYFFSSGDDGEVDFWWVKPVKGSSTEIEQATLSRQAKGPHKNDPGRSKPFYKPLADMFKQRHEDKEGKKFLIEKPPGKQSSRALIEESKANGGPARLWIHLVWQEDWTSPTAVFAKSKYIKGKIVYQKDPTEIQFFAREYCIKDSVFTLSEFEDQPYHAILPGENIKELFEPA